MTSFIKVFNTASQNLSAISDQSIDLIITSPPYPMIEMWDDCFCVQNEKIRDAIENSAWQTAYQEMHAVLNQVWEECHRVLKPNGFVCINIGDATRTCGGQFHLFSNHTNIIRYFEEKGYSVLPDIHWRKQTNAPNKFMGSGMLPAGAYVTYEHEYILIFRKGGKRVFKGDDIQRRSKSAYFWEERNVWFSDLWDIKGTSQLIKIPSSRNRSAAFPFEVPYRLVQMYSVYGDTILDPFGGIGTTALACAASGRNCIISEIDSELSETIKQNVINILPGLSAETMFHRIERHNQFIESMPDVKKQKCYINAPHGFLVKTRQETQLTCYQVATISEEKASGTIYIDYQLLDVPSFTSKIKSPELLTV